MSDDVLDDLRTELEAVEATPPEEHPEVFDRVHRALVAELNALEEV